MSDEYLWDRRGDPDPDIARLEAVLGAYAHHPDPERLLENPPPRGPTRRSEPRRQGFRRPHIYGLLAASLLAAFGLGALFLEERAPTLTAFTVEATHGTPRYASQPLQGTFALSVDAWLQTDEADEARITLANHGELYVSGNTSLRFKRLDQEMPVIELRYGRIQRLTHAASPGLANGTLMSLETPSMLANDRGGVYELTVDGSGWTRLRVDRGQVALLDQTTGRSAVVPAGALCETLPGQGLGIPTFTTASVRLRRAVRTIDLTRLGGDDPRQGLNFSVVLIESEPQDTLSLYHMVDRVDPPRRVLIVNRICSLVPLPDDLERQQLLRADPHALVRWREHLMPVWLDRPRPRDGAFAPQDDGRL